MSRWRPRLLLAGGALFAFGLACVLALELFLQRPQGRSGGPPLTIEVNSGSTAQEVAEELERKGIVGPAWIVGRAMRLSGVHRTLQAGEYAFEPPVSPAQVMRVLDRGQVVTVLVAVREGLTLSETAEVISQAGIAEAKELIAAFSEPSVLARIDPEAEDLEGYLFPDSYRFPRNYDAAGVAQEMVANFRRKFLDPNRRRIDAGELGLREVVALASLVEKETGRGDERDRIAGVFLERLDRGMRLQCDPTVIFALKREGLWDGRIHKRDLAWDHPYNTYTRRGLPPGPIASPGLDSLLAVLEPERGGELFFVSRGDGSHAFARTLEEHQRNVRRYILKR